MKILFIGVGLVHYYNRVLNRLNAFDGIEVVNLIPRNSRGHLQEGVFQTKDGVLFKVCELEAYSLKPFYHSFRGLASLLRTERPDIIVVTEYYIRTFLFNLPVIFFVKKLGIKLVMKSIPFRIKKYREALAEIQKTAVNAKDLPPVLAATTKFPFILKALLRIQLEIFRISYKIPDAHVNYVEDAFTIYGSYGVSKEKIFITYNSPDTDYLFSVRASIEKEPSILPPCSRRLVHVGRLVEWKRVDLLIGSFARVIRKHADAELLVIGTGPQEAALKKRAEILQLQDSVQFIGSVYDAHTLGKYLLSSSIYVLAGMGGLSINDAMCFGLPVICSVCDGTETRLVKEGYNGLYFEEGNEKDLAEKIIYLLNNPQMVKKKGGHSTDIIKNEINIHTVINGYLNAFNYVMQNQL